MKEMQENISMIKVTDDESDDEDIFVNEERIKKIDLDPTAFPNAADLQKDENLGRLKIALDLGRY